MSTDSPVLPSVDTQRGAELIILTLGKEFKDVITIVSQGSLLDDSLKSSHYIKV